MLSDIATRRRSRAARCGGSFGAALRSVRCEQHIDQLSLALALGASDASYICRLERGVRVNPSFEFVRRLIAAFSELDCPLSMEQRARLALAAIRDPASPQETWAGDTQLNVAPGLDRIAVRPRRR